MEIKGFIDTTFLDWDGKVASTVFTAGCNLRCVFCHNYGLVLNPNKYPNVEEKGIFEFLKEHKDFIDGVCITGGEPTLQENLGEFCQKIKTLGINVKLDTNGTAPKVLADLIQRGLVDYVAMDIKAPLDEKSYARVAGVPCEVNRIKESICILMSGEVDYEFRTTVVPSIHSEEDIEKISKEIQGAKLYVLQKFQPKFALDESLRTQPIMKDEEILKFVDIAGKYVEKAIFRGK
jgi:pyruvate formate lyase activating enzyme